MLADIYDVANVLEEAVAEALRMSALVHGFPAPTNENSATGGSKKHEHLKIMFTILYLLPSNSKKSCSGKGRLH